jgi:hypothetical protein
MGSTVKGLGLGACVSDAYSVGVSSGSLFQPVSESACLTGYETTQAFIRHHALCCHSRKMNIRSYNAFHYIMHECLYAYCVHLTLDIQILLEHFASDVTLAQPFFRSCTRDCKPHRSLKNSGLSKINAFK